MSKRVLIAPLDWGLGHATRCIPIIQEFLEQGAEVILASDGRAYQLLQREFPHAILELLPSYKVQYPTHNMIWNMILQAPKIIWAIWQEHWYLQKIIKKHQINFVLSDNRFGCFSKKIPSIFITHQINIQVPNIFLQLLVRALNRIFLRQFAACWIPDVPGEDRIAGNLSQANDLKNQKYIGILSRMQPLELPIRHDLLVVLSGPEPQRTRLEEAILQQLRDLPYTCLLVQGKPEESGNGGIGEWGNGGMGDRRKVEIVPFLDAKSLNQAMATAEVIICRAGYSTIMDLAVLGKKAIFIPTPGQTEQEYLAKRLFEKQLFYYQKQTELNLAEALEKIHDFPGFKWQDYQHSRMMLKKAVFELLKVND